MVYVFDTNALSVIFNHYYVNSFPTFWESFHKHIIDRKIISVREVRKELEEKGWGDTVDNWIKSNSSFFESPSVDEMNFITKIYSVSHFLHNLENEKLLKGGAFADPFVISKAHSIKGIVVTQEKYKKNGTKIPNICEHFKIECINLENFFIRESWKF